MRNQENTLFIIKRNRRTGEFTTDLLDDMRINIDSFANNDIEYYIFANIIDWNRKVNELIQLQDKDKCDLLAELLEERQGR